MTFLLRTLCISSWARSNGSYRGLESSFQRSTGLPKEGYKAQGWHEVVQGLEWQPRKSGGQWALTLFHKENGVSSIFRKLKQGRCAEYVFCLHSNPGGIVGS